ncbi:MAG: hypothetical protein QM743_06940 [Chitinophagaceae bacterium]
MRLTDEELEDLKDYTDNPDNAPFATIQTSIKVAPKTVKGLLKNGYAEMSVVVKVRDFLKAIKQMQADA